MENVERTQFVVLTGHLDDRPLPDLMRTLRVQRKTGRLQVEYPDAPAAFFFEEGQLVDAQLGNLRGVEALYAALSMQGASFNFNPLVRPPERSIDRQGQKFVQDLIETPRRNNLSELRVVGREPTDANAAPLDLPPAAAAQLPPAPQTALVRLEPGAAAALTAPLEARLTAVEAAIEHTSRRFSRERLVYLVVISFLVGVTVTTAVQAISGLRRRAGEAAAQAQQPAAQRETAGATNATSPASATGAGVATNRNTASAASGAGVANDGAARAGGQNDVAGSRGAAANAASREPLAKREQGAKQSQAGAGVAASERESRKSEGGYVVDVLMEVKGGRVTEARVLNPRAGGGAYEALALRMARQRRYPDNFTGADTWKIRVKP